MHLLMFFGVNSLKSTGVRRLTSPAAVVARLRQNLQKLFARLKRAVMFRVHYCLENRGHACTFRKCTCVRGCSSHQSCEACVGRPAARIEIPEIPGRLFLGTKDLMINSTNERPTCDRRMLIRTPKLWTVLTACSGELCATG
jgi:hypothetical protein